MWEKIPADVECLHACPRQYPLQRMKTIKSLMPEEARVQCAVFCLIWMERWLTSLPASSPNARVYGPIVLTLLMMRCWLYSCKQAITSLRHFMAGKSEEIAEFTRLEQIEATETAGITALPGQSIYSIT